VPAKWPHQGNILITVPSQVFWLPIAVTVLGIPAVQKNRKKNLGFIISCTDYHYIALVDPLNLIKGKEKFWPDNFVVKNKRPHDKMTRIQNPLSQFIRFWSLEDLLRCLAAHDQ
jgi:hypothetical protein